jgi:YidC/Oxa1 family membrane protein insertase
MSFFSDFYNELVNRPVTNIVQVFENITHDTGLAFVLISVLANAIMWPIYKKMYIDGQKTRYLTPELTRIQEAYKANPKEMLTKRGELLKKHNIQNGRSFLAILLQIPFLLAIFHVVQLVSNRDAVTGLYSFISPDGLGHFSGTFFGVSVAKHPNEFSWGLILPLIVGLLSYLQGMFIYRWAKKPALPEPEKIVKPNADPNTPDFAEQLQKSIQIQMIYIIPFIYMFFNYTVTIGLNAYLIAGTLIGTLRQVYLNWHYVAHADELMKEIIEDDPYLKKHHKILKEKGALIEQK